MKRIYSLLALATLLVGCSSEDSDLTIKPAAPSAATKVDLLTVTPSAPTPSTVDPLNSASENTAETESEPLLTNGDKRAELADLTEKVYLKWNAALADYKKQNNRLPASLDELRKSQPALTAHHPPRGFKLQYDKQNGEIYVVHAGKHRANNVANSQVVGFPPPPVVR